MNQVINELWFNQWIFTCSCLFRYESLGNALSQKVQGYGVPSVTPIVYDICISSIDDVDVVSLDATVSVGLHGVTIPVEKKLKKLIEIRIERFLFENIISKYNSYLNIKFWLK